MNKNNPIEANKKTLLILGGIILFLVLALIYFTIPKTSVIKNVDVGINPPIGNIDAKVKIIEFSDFQCPACKSAEPIVDDILNKYGEDVVFYYRNFPLPMHENSFIAAEAAECANQEGEFWEYHDYLFENQNRLDKNSLKKYAENLGLDKGKFDACLDNEETREIVLTDVSDAKKLGLRGTPTFFINGREIFGSNERELRKLIEEELR